MRARFSKDRVELRLPRADELALRGAAYVMTGSAYAAIAGKRGARAVVLWPKAGAALKDLARDFAREYDNQLLRWKLLRLNRKISTEVLARAMTLSTANAAGAPAPGSSSLSEERRREIESVVREAGKEAWDPLGIARPWEQMRGGKE